MTQLEKEIDRKALALEILKDLSELFTFKEIWDMIDFSEIHLGKVCKKGVMWDKLTKALLNLTFNEKTIMSKHFEKKVILTSNK